MSPAKARSKTVIKDGVMTIVNLEAETSVSLPWPPPPLPAGRLGMWAPAVMARHPDGTATGLWHWEDARPGRADEPPEEAA